MDGMLGSGWTDLKKNKAIPRSFSNLQRKEKNSKAKTKKIIKATFGKMLTN